MCSSLCCLSMRLPPLPRKRHCHTRAGFAECRTFDAEKRFLKLHYPLKSCMFQISIQSFSRQATRDFHVGGSEKGSQLAQKIRATWTSQEMKSVRVEVFRPLLSYPDMERANEVRLTKGSRVIYHLNTSHLESQLGESTQRIQIRSIAFSISIRLGYKPCRVRP